MNSWAPGRGGPGPGQGGTWAGIRAGTRGSGEGPGPVGWDPGQWDPGQYAWCCVPTVRVLPE